MDRARGCRASPSAAAPIAVADGRRVRAARSGVLRIAATGRRVVDAVGVDGRRLAWIERGTRRGARVGVIRLGRLR